MEFVEKMKEAMQMVADACNLNTDWCDCKYCPFRTYCDAMEIQIGITPADENFIGE